MPATKHPAGGMPARRARAPAAGALIGALLLVASCTATTTASPSPSASPTLEPTAEPTASPTAVPKEPAADLDELLTRLYAALDTQDSGALASINQAGTIHAVYYTNGIFGEEVASIAMDGYDLATAGFTAVEATGEPVVVGDVVAVPVSYTYPEGVYTGFDVMRIVEVGGGLLIGDGGTFYGPPNEADPQALATIEAETAAWIASDVEGILATYTDDAAFWEGIVEGDRTIHTGADLSVWLAVSVGFTAENVGDPATSGEFVAVANHLIGDTASDTADGISLYEIRDGKIALHLFIMAS